MLRGRAAPALSILAMTFASNADAQVALVERVRIQGGYITEQRPEPQERINDAFVGIVPDLTLHVVGPRADFRAGYTFSGTLHTTYPSQIAHTGTIGGRYELSVRTQLSGSASVSKTTLTNLLLTRPTTQAATSVLPTGSSTDVIVGLAEQGLAHQVNPDVRAEQHTSVTVFSALTPSAPLDSVATALSGSAERVWKDNAVGPEASIGYTLVRTRPPAPDQDYLLGSAAPHWRHDWNRSLSSLVAAGVAGLVSPDGSTDAILAPFGRGSLLWTIEAGTGFELAASTGVTPNPLTGQAIQGTQVTLRGVAPLSTANAIFVGGTLGYVRGALIGRRGDADQGFNSASADVELTWRPTDYIDLFARYTFLAQITDDAGATGFPSFLRDSFLLGVSLASHPPDFAARRRSRGRVGPGEATTFPQRVDRADGEASDRGRLPEADERLRARPPEGVGGTRWIYTTPARPPEEVPARP